MQKNKITSMLIALFALQTFSLAETSLTESPYLANPVALHRHINRTTPNLIIVVDNSNDMGEKMLLSKSDTNHNKKPRYIDAVKSALINMYPNHYDRMNISLVTLNDLAKDLHWKKDDSQPSGYQFANFTGNDGIAPLDIPTLYDIAPFNENNQPLRVYGTGGGHENLGFSNYRNRKYVDNIVTHETTLPSLSSINIVDNKQMGKSLLVPFYKVSSNADKANYLRELDLMTKTIAISDGKLSNIYPSAVDYVADQIQYRCQESYVLIMTNDVNLINDPKIVQASTKYIQAHPKKDNERDAENKLYNQSDFPNQHVKTYLIALDALQKDNSKPEDNNNGEHNILQLHEFGLNSGGHAFTATNEKDVLLYTQEYLNDMQPKTVFTGTAPAVYTYIDDDNKVSQMWISAISDPHNWHSQLQFRKNRDDLYFDKAGYSESFADIYMDTPKGVILLQYSDKTNDRWPLLAKDLTAQDFNLPPNHDVQDFILWLTAGSTNKMAKYNGKIGDEAFPDYRDRSYGLRSDKRFLADMSNDSIETMGHTSQDTEFTSEIEALSALTVTSNDGMFKIYRKNPLYRLVDPEFAAISESTPYFYELAYIPGNARRMDGTTLMQNMQYRADKNYGSGVNSPNHEYGISGQTAYRTTNKGQTFVVNSIGQGGMGAFALNIAGTAHHDPSQKVGIDAEKDQWGHSMLLWDTNSEKFGDAYTGSDTLGHILTRPVIARVALNRNQGAIADLYKDVKYAAVLPSGAYGDQSVEAGPTLYFYDAIGVDVAINVDKKTGEPGKLLKKVTYQPEDGELTFKNSLTGVTLVDLDFNGVADVGYAGDLNGNLYRVDLRAPLSEWKLELIYKGDPSQPITQSPSVSRYDEKNVVIFGTGSYNRKIDFREAMPQQAIYGIFENASFTAHSQKPLTPDANFLVQTLTTSLDEKHRTLSNAKVNSDHIGWKIPLSETARETVMQKPIIFNGTIFLQTYVLHDKNLMPDNAMCYRPEISPDTWLFQINARTGGTLSKRDTKIPEMGDEHVQQFDSVILPTLKLVTTRHSSGVSKDGEMQNGNDPDFDLEPKNSTDTPASLSKSHYLNSRGTCDAILTNGYTLICPKSTLVPKRLSVIHKE